MSNYLGEFRLFFWIFKVMQSNGTYITALGFEWFENELHYLRTVKRAEIAQNLHDTMGDEEDNEHFFALDEKYFIEGRIQDLELLLATFNGLHLVPQMAMSEWGVPLLLGKMAPQWKPTQLLVQQKRIHEKA